MNEVWRAGNVPDPFFHELAMSPLPSYNVMKRWES